MVVSFQEKQQDAASMKLYARQQGQGTDLISVHGLFGSQENLGAINRRLADHYRVHGVDVRNHGCSPHDNSMTYADMASDLLEYLDDQGIDQAHLLGHSMGGKIVMEMALQNPERVLNVGVLDIAPVRYTRRRHDEVFSGLEAIRLDKLAQRSEADLLLRDYIREPAIRQFLLKNLYRNDQGQFAWRINLPVIIENYWNILAGQDTEKTFERPVHFLRAEHSDYIQPSHREQVLALFPNASVKTIQSTGHWLHAEKPDLVAASLLRFYQTSAQ